MKYLSRQFKCDSKFIITDPLDFAMHLASEKSLVHVVGNGLLGNAFRHSPPGEKCLVLAAGVSNSKETRPDEFARERSMIISNLQRFRDYRAIYFSTCSADSVEKTAYTEHKLEMEHLIKSHSQSWTIFRLPQVVGVVMNTTIVSYFVARIMGGAEILINSRAERNIIDVMDVVRIVRLLLASPESRNVIINVAAADSVPALDLAIYIGHILGRPANIMMKDAGCPQDINIEFLRKNLSEDDPVLIREYWKKVLRTYVPRIAEIT